MPLVPRVRTIVRSIAIASGVILLTFDRLTKRSRCLVRDCKLRKNETAVSGSSMSDRTPGAATTCGGRCRLSDTGSDILCRSSRRASFFHFFQRLLRCREFFDRTRLYSRQRTSVQRFFTRFNKTRLQHNSTSNQKSSNRRVNNLASPSMHIDPPPAFFVRPAPEMIRGRKWDKLGADGRFGGGFAGAPT